MKQRLSLWKHSIKQLHSLIEYLASITNLFKSGYKSNALAPYVWYGILTTVAGIVILYLFKDDPIIKYFCLFIIGFVIVYVAFMGVLLFKKDPNLLRTEQYLLEDKKLSVAAKKGIGILVNPVNLTFPTKIEGGDNE